MAFFTLKFTLKHTHIYKGLSLFHVDFKKNLLVYLVQMKTKVSFSLQAFFPHRFSNWDVFPFSVRYPANLTLLKMHYCPGTIGLQECHGHQVMPCSTD